MLTDHFEELKDKRQIGKRQHNLLEIIVMTICAVMAGCDAWEDIADFCRVKEDWLRERLHLRLRNGIPSHDTMARVWGMIDPEEFQKCFRSWVSTICHPAEGEIVSIDGKTLRGSKSSQRSAIHMVSAWAHEQQLVLGQVATDEKSNEITAVPNLLEVLDLKGCIVTADAASCQKQIVQKLNEKDSEYVISLKDNQPNLRQDTAAYFEAAQKDPPLYPDIQHFQTVDKGHGRIEVRNYYLTTDITWLTQREDWARLRSLGFVRSRVTSGDCTTEEVRYFISSLQDVKRFAKAVRAHWGIENSLHWCLDVTFHEDYSRIRNDHSAQNMAVVRHIALDVLKSFPSKLSLARKRRHCAYDDDFLALVVLSICA